MNTNTLAPLRCVICCEIIQPDGAGWSEGHNAAPVKEGRCCEACNWLVVVPTRIRRAAQHQQEVRDGSL